MNAQSTSSAFQRRQGFRAIDGGRAQSTSSIAAFEVPYHRSCWMDASLARLDYLTSLDRGWDGYDGQPVSYTCASFAASIMEAVCVDHVPAPSLVPGSDGTVQMEWHMAGYDIEVLVRGINDVIAVRYSYQTDEEEVVELKSDFSILVEWIDDLGRALGGAYEKPALA